MAITFIASIGSSFMYGGFLGVMAIGEIAIEHGIPSCIFGSTE